LLTLSHNQSLSSLSLSLSLTHRIHIFLSNFSNFRRGSTLSKPSEQVAFKSAIVRDDKFSMIKFLDEKKLRRQIIKTITIQPTSPGSAPSTATAVENFSMSQRMEYQSQPLLYSLTLLSTQEIHQQALSAFSGKQT
jgi:hypothetical protein